MSMQTLIIKGPDQQPDRFWCATCNDFRRVLADADAAREHAATNPGHVVRISVVRVDIMVAGGDLWVVSPYTMSEAAEGPSET